MSPASMACLGQRWASAALGEHASVAAFAHVVLHMMNLGAPPPLLLAAIRAMKEEVQHAQLCFSVAKKFLGHPVGPGQLNVPSFSAALDQPERILDAAIAEGCIDETISTQYARQASASCVDHGIQVVLDKIVDDEDRHAELSWNFVAWMLAQDPALVPVAQASFRQHLAQRAVAGVPDDTDLVEGHGILGAAAQTRARAHAIEHVILPRARALLACDLVHTQDG